MASEDPFSYDLTALVDYEPDQTTAPPTIGVGGGRLNTPYPPASVSPGIGVGTNNTSPSILANVTVGVGGTRTLRQQAGRPPTPSGQGYLDDRPTVGHKSPVQEKDKQQSARTKGMKDRRLVARATKSAKEPRRVPRQNTPSSPSEDGDLRRSGASSSSSDSGGRGSGRGSGGG